MPRAVRCRRKCGLGAARNDHWHRQPTTGLPGCRAKLPVAAAVVFAPAFPAAIQVSEQHQREADERARPKPAMQSSPLETTALTPDKIMELEGGMIMPNSALVARSAAAQPTGSWCLMWEGIKMTPLTTTTLTANAVATDKPDATAKIMQVSTQSKSKPPCTPPKMFLANSTKRR